MSQRESLGDDSLYRAENVWFCPYLNIIINQRIVFEFSAMQND